MAKQIINVGAAINDGTGDALRNGAQKINDNFSELYNALGGSNGGPLELVSKINSGNGIVVSSGFGEVLVSANTASADTAGVIKIGAGLNMVDGVLSAPSTYSLPRAASNILGGVKVGSNLTISNDGTLSAVPQNYTLPTPSASVKGGIKIGSGLEMIDGVLNVVNAEIASALQSGSATLSYTSLPEQGHSILSSNFGVSMASIGNLYYTGMLWANEDGLVQQVTVNSLGTTIYSQDTVEQISHQWRFRADGILTGPYMGFGTYQDQDQIISLTGENNITFGNKDFVSYIRIEGSDDTNVDNVGVSVPRANTIRIYSNNIGRPGNYNTTSPGRIILEAGGYQNEHAAKIYMGQPGDPSHNFPPTGEPVVTTTNNIEITGGVAFYGGDVTLQGASTLGIRNRIVFQDGSIQTTAYQGRAGISASRDGFVTVPVSADTVIYSGASEVGAVKLLVVASMEVTGETQACEIIGVISQFSTLMPISVYGIVYTGAAPIITFDSLYDAPTDTYTITARPVGTVFGCYVTVQISEVFRTTPP